MLRSIVKPAHIKSAGVITAGVTAGMVVGVVAHRVSRPMMPSMIDAVKKCRVAVMDRVSNIRKTGGEAGITQDSMVTDQVPVAVG